MLFGQIFVIQIWSGELIEIDSNTNWPVNKSHHGNLFQCFWLTHGDKNSLKFQFLSNRRFNHVIKLESFMNFYWSLIGFYLKLRWCPFSSSFCTPKCRLSAFLMLAHTSVKSRCLPDTEIEFWLPLIPLLIRIFTSHKSGLHIWVVRKYWQFFFNT